MSVEIKGKTIIITRGDTLITKVSIFDSDGKEYTPSSSDVIRFALKKKYTDLQPLITKTIPNNTLELRLDSVDTKKLELSCKYVYDVQITYGNGIVDTFIPRGTLITKEEVD